MLHLSPSLAHPQPPHSSSAALSAEEAMERGGSPHTPRCHLSAGRRLSPSVPGGPQVADPPRRSVRTLGRAPSPREAGAARSCSPAGAVPLSAVPEGTGLSPPARFASLPASRCSRPGCGGGSWQCEERTSAGLFTAASPSVRPSSASRIPPRSSSFSASSAPPALRGPRGAGVKRPPAPPPSAGVSPQLITES